MNAKSQSSYSQRSSSVDRRVNYSSRSTASSSSEVPSVLKSAWLSLVKSSGLGETVEQISRRLWFSLTPGKLTAFEGPSSHTPVFLLRLNGASVRAIDSPNYKYICFVIEGKVWDIKKVTIIWILTPFKQKVSIHMFNLYFHIFKWGTDTGTLLYSSDGLQSFSKHTWIKLFRLSVLYNKNNSSLENYK